MQQNYFDKQIFYVKFTFFCKKVIPYYNKSSLYSEIHYEIEPTHIKAQKL